MSTQDNYASREEKIQLAKNTEDPSIIAAIREEVIVDYTAAKAKNHRRFLQGDITATSEYIYQNQMEDANNIVDIFYNEDVRVVSVQKMTKVGADGLMIEIMKLMTSHNDDEFIINPDNVRIITGMSNVKWENDMIDKAPGCFKDKIFHHGKLKKSDLMNIKNALIIIDEIDSGDKEGQILHKTLKDACILDVNHMKENNIRFLVISATMIKTLNDLYRWGSLHKTYKMSIPSSYIGHIDFLKMGLIQEFYAMNTPEKAEKWIQEDIIGHYGSNFRVHIARVTKKNVDILQDACIRKGITFRNHNSDDRLSQEEINVLFINTLNKHIVFGVKGFYRRANLIPNKWKLRIGATHELYKKIPDYSTEIQALPGRMTGYWRDVIENGYKTGPHRTSIKSIEEYEKVYNDPLCENKYKTNSNISFTHPKHIENLISIDHPAEVKKKELDAKYDLHVGEFATLDESNKFMKENRSRIKNEKTIAREERVNGTFYKSSTTGKVDVLIYDEVKKEMSGWSKFSNFDKKKKPDTKPTVNGRLYICYKKIDDPTSVVFIARVLVPK